MQFHSGNGVRKEVENDSGGHPQFFAKEENLVEFSEGLFIGHHDEFIYAAPFQQRAYFFLPEYANELEPPVPLFLDSVAELDGSGAAADHRHMAHIQGSMLLGFQKQDTIRNKQKVVDS